MGPVHAALLTTLGQLIALLRRHGEEHWSQWLAVDAQRIRNGDLYGLEHLLSAFGGMGSLTDLVLCHENGFPVAAAEVGRVNASLDELRSRTYDLARELLAN